MEGREREKQKVQEEKEEQELGGEKGKGKITEVVVSVQRAGSERGKRIYFDSKSVEEIRQECGDDFFLLTERTLIAFIDPYKQKITLAPLKGIYEKYSL